jgi:hypothetical protein
MLAPSGWLSMIYTPHNGDTYTAPFDVPTQVLFLVRPQACNKCKQPQDQVILKRLARRYSILRTYTKNVDMRGLNPGETGVLCASPLGVTRLARQPFEQSPLRISMVAHVPELHLVVVGSEIGRVGLLTLTKINPNGAGAPMQRKLGISRGFRVDWVLPSKRDEEAALRPTSRLYGMAIGPVQESVLGGSSSLLLSDSESMTNRPPRKYRLMLHYRDFTILSYEISRDAKGDLSVV